MPGLKRNNLVWAQTLQSRQYSFQLKGESFGEQPVACVTHAGFHHWKAVKGLVPWWAEAEGNVLSSISAVCYLLQQELMATSCHHMWSLSHTAPFQRDSISQAPLRTLGQCQGWGSAGDHWTVMYQSGGHPAVVDIIQVKQICLGLVDVVTSNPQVACVSYALLFLFSYSPKYEVFDNWERPVHVSVCMPQRCYSHDKDVTYHTLLCVIATMNLP